MTAPIAGLQEATPLHAAHYWHLQITGPDQGVIIAELLGAAAAAKLITMGSPEIHVDNEGTVTWALKITNDGNNFTHAAPGDYVVVSTDDAGQLTSIQLYKGPNGTYDNPLFSDKFQT